METLLYMHVTNSIINNSHFMSHISFLRQHSLSFPFVMLLALK